MKKSLILILILSSWQFCFSQNFATIGTEWYYSSTANGSMPPFAEYYYLQSVKDTLIEEKNVNKIICKHYKHDGDTIELEPFFVYEKSDTVFIYCFEKSIFQKLYIFNAEQGDTLILDIPSYIEWTEDTSYRLIIDTVKIEVFGGISLKKYKTTALDFIEFTAGGYFMDRVGGLDWFFPHPPTIPEDIIGPVRCYSDNEVDIKFQEIDCDYLETTHIESKLPKYSFDIYPNPANDKIIIEYDLTEINNNSAIEIIDFTGKQVKYIPIKQEKNKVSVDVSGLPPGYYIITVWLNTTERYTKKVSIH